MHFKPAGFLAFWNYRFTRREHDLFVFILVLGKCYDIKKTIRQKKNLLGEIFYLENRTENTRNSRSLKKSNKVTVLKPGKT